MFVLTLFTFFPFLTLQTFVFTGGCQGNANRFATATFCEEACKRDNPQRPPQKVGPQGSLVDVCHLPADSGKSFNIIFFVWLFFLVISFQVHAKRKSPIGFSTPHPPNVRHSPTRDVKATLIDSLRRNNVCANAGLSKIRQEN